jgi:signal transduction histidine kinase
MDQTSSDEIGFGRSVLGALLELSQVDRMNWDGGIQQILRVDARVLDVERVSYWRNREDPAAIVCEMAYQRTTGAFERGSVLSAAEHRDYFGAIYDGPVSVRDASTDPRTSSLHEYLEPRGIASLLDFPVWVRGSVAGVLCHEHVGTPRVWSNSDQHFAATVAQVIASSLSSRERTQAEEATVRAAFLDQASHTLGETLDPGEVSRRALDLVVPRFADGAMIDVLEEGALRPLGSTFATVEGRTVLQEAIRERSRMNRMPYLGKNVVSRRNSVFIPLLTEEAIIQTHLGGTELRLIRSLQIRSAMAIPLLCGRRLVGTMIFYAQKHQFGTTELRLVEEFGIRVAYALENARLHRRAQAAVQARDEFIELAAHELRTPVTSLLLAAEASRRRSSTAVPDAGSERIVTQVRRLQQLIDQMLDYSLIAARKLQLSRANTDLAEVARKAAQAWQGRFERAGSTLTLTAGSPVFGQWDSMRLEQMLSSLLDNALKFGRGKPTEITVGAATGEMATLTVRDHGGGIPVERLPLVFDAFERAVSSDHYGGFGLGLYIARAIAEVHGGRLTVENSPGEGAAFTAILPISTPI